MKNPRVKSKKIFEPWQIHESTCYRISHLAEFEKVNAEYASKITNLEESSRTQGKTEEVELKLKVVSLK